MFPAPYSRTRTERDRGVAAGISAALHAAAFVALVHAPAVKLPRPSESEYRQSFAGKEEKIVWYKFRRELPKVAPPRTDAGEKPLRAENKSEQAIVSAAVNAPRKPRMVWTPAPAIRNVEPLDSPNMVAVKLPPPPSKSFIAPPEKQQSNASPKLAQPAPQLAANELKPVGIPDVRLAPKPFSTPITTERKRIPARIVEADAPAISVFAAPRASDIQVTLAAKPFTAPPARLGNRAMVRVSENDAPALTASSTIPRAALPNVTGLPPKPFTAPSRPQAVGPMRSITIEPTPPPVEANARDLNLVAVGLNPLDRPLPPPSASPANFSAGKQLRSSGASAQRSDGALSVPGLYVGKSREKAAADLLAQAYEPPTSAGNLRAAMRPAVISNGSGPGENDSTSHSGAVRVANAPEARFEGRDVFMMAIQMPNLTSYSGSWLMWYADRTQRVAGLEPIAPPVPHRKVDPKYIASAVADRIEGKVRLACVITKDGLVSGVELLRGLDDRLNKSAEEALAKWEFYPAKRNGQAVEVDVVVEIPFRLEPLAPKP